MRELCLSSELYPVSPADIAALADTPADLQQHVKDEITVLIGDSQSGQTRNRTALRLEQWNGSAQAAPTGAETGGIPTAKPSQGKPPIIPSCKQFRRFADNEDTPGHAYTE